MDSARIPRSPLSVIVITERLRETLSRKKEIIMVGSVESRCSDNRTFMRNTIDRHYLVAVTLCYALEIDCMISFKLKTNTNWRSNNA